MANVKIWYHDAARIDANGRETLVLNEPSLNTGDAAETYTSGAVAVNTTGAPNATAFAWVETDADIRYTVNNPSPAAQNTATANHKKISAGEGAIAMRPNQTLSIIDA